MTPISINDAVQKSLIEWVLINQQNLGLESVPPGVLQDNLNTILPDIVGNYTNTIYSNTNQSLNQGPVDLIGSNNPFNVLTENNSINSVSGAVLNNIGFDSLNLLQTGLIVNLVNSLQGRLGNDSGINFTNLITTLSSSIGPLLGTLNKDVSSSFLSVIFNSGQQTFGILDSKDLSIPSFIEDPVEDLEALDTSYTQKSVNSFLQESKNFNVQNEDNLNILEKTKEGFCDVTGTYPTKEYENSSEVNKLAQGSPTNSLVQAKEKSRLKSAALPGGKSFAEPKSAYKAEYPYNKVTETEQGHVFEIDDTPGSERIHIYHKAGTYIEIDRDGNTVFKRKGSDYQIIDRNGYVSIAGHLNLSVAGSINLYTGNDANVEITGDATVTIHNDAVIQAGGNLDISAANTISMHAHDIRIEADNNFDLQVDGTFKHRANIIHTISEEETYIEIGKDYHVTGNTNAKIYFEDDYKLKTGKKIKLNGKTGIEQKSTLGAVTAKSPAGGMNIDGNGFNIRSPGPINIDGSTIKFQNNQATLLDLLDFDIEDPVRPEGARNALIGMLSGKKDYVAVEVADSAAMSVSDSVVLGAEEPNDSPESKQRLRDALISKGFSKDIDLDSNPIPQGDSKSPTSANNQIIQPSDFCLGLQEAPDSFKLSPNFTLGQLTSRAAAGGHKLVAQSGLNFGQLLKNLQSTALNVCEPVFNLYPNMIVTSGFRPEQKYPNSQHRLGEAVDIQFRGLPKSDYFKIANLLAQSLNYDQLLLEYCSYANNPWIHISFSAATKNKKQVLTFWNHKTHAQGLVNLA